MKIKNKNKIEFICPICKTREKIPTDVVRMMDESDLNLLIEQYHQDSNVIIVKEKWYQYYI